MPTYRIINKIALAGFISSTFSVSSYAGGFQLSDHSITSLGRGHAGYGLLGDDASAVEFNPAAMSLLDRQQLQAGISYLRVKAAYTELGSDGFNTGVERDGAGDSLAPNLYWVIPINQRARFGLGITSPLGTDTDYTDNANGRFIGRYSGLKTDIITLNINPSLSYQINDTFSVGFGLNFQKIDANLVGAGSPAALNSTLDIEGDDGNWGYNIGLMASFTDSSRLGISYRSKIDHTLAGTATFSGFNGLVPGADGSFDATAEFIAPETVYVGYTKPLGKSAQLSLGYRWTRWSRFQELDILFPDGVASQNSLLVTRWNDSETISAGIDYTLNQQWTLRGGFTLDQTPIPDSSRSVRTVDADRTWYSVGASYHASKNVQWDFAYRYISFENAPIDRTISRTGFPDAQLVGEFNDVDVHTYAIQINYKL